MSANLHIGVHLYGPVREHDVNVLRTEAGPFVSLDVPISGGCSLVLHASDPADLRALAAGCERAAAALAEILRAELAQEPVTAAAGGEGTA